MQRLSFLVLSFLICVQCSYAQDKTPPEKVADLADLSLEELLKLNVTSVSKKSQNIQDAAAAVYVLTNEDIRRSGATSIPEVLRLVPGLHVARISANNWAVTSRGFNGLFANKLLVLMDGRSVYTPLFSGVFWDTQDTLLEDIDRIEVIRGPGAALWGSNAVNGVINIITKHAEDTKGGLLTLGGGDEERGFAGLRYGGETETKINYRSYLKYYDRDDNSRAFSAGNVHDSSKAVQGGFRADWDISSQNALTLQGDVYYNDEGFEFIEPILFPPFDEFRNERRYLHGANLLTRWTHIFEDESESQLQFYYDQVSRDDGVLAHSRDTIDLDFQHRFRLSTHQELLWGAGYRFYSDDIDDSRVISFDPDRESLSQETFFLHDEIELIEERLKFIVGSKFEQNELSGFEIQPNARLLLTPEEEQTYWLAVSRAVRTPSRSTDDINLNYVSGQQAGLPFLVAFQGSNQYESEDLMSYELGYRGRLRDDLVFDVATFINHYENLQTLEPQSPLVDSSLGDSLLGFPHILLPRVFDNEASANAHGVELSLDYQARECWRWVFAYTYFNLNIDTESSSGDDFVELMEGTSPDHQAQVRSQLDITDDLEFDTILRYVDSLPAINIEDYFALDFRLAFDIEKDLELSLIAQNITDSKHEEFFSNDFVRGDVAAIERGFYLKLRRRF